MIGTRFPFPYFHTTMIFFCYLIVLYILNLIYFRFESKLSTKLIKCYQCANQISLGKNISTCQECNIVVHASCVKEVPRTCGLPHAYAKHYTDSVRRVLNASKEENKSKDNIEGWVKVPM